METNASENQLVSEEDEYLPKEAKDDDDSETMSRNYYSNKRTQIIDTECRSPSDARPTKSALIHRLHSRGNESQTIRKNSLADGKKTANRIIESLREEVSDVPTGTHHQAADMNKDALERQTNMIVRLNKQITSICKSYGVATMDKQTAQSEVADTQSRLTVEIRENESLRSKLVEMNLQSKSVEKLSMEVDLLKHEVKRATEKRN